jgi:hypothetical protein
MKKNKLKGLIKGERRYSKKKIRGLQAKNFMAAIGCVVYEAYRAIVIL